MTLDSHQHYWQYNPKVHGWIDNNMSILKRDFLPSDLSTELNNTNIQGCVAVQAATTEEETEWLLQLANENDFIKGVVGWLDLKSTALESRLDYLLKKYPQNKLVGLREITQGTKKENFLANEHFIKGLRAIEHYGLTYDILIYHHQIEDAIFFIEKLPSSLKLIIDHIAKPNIKDKEIDIWHKGMEKLAKFPNVYCKISGMITEASATWKDCDFHPYLDVVFKHFSIDKLCFGSDWPVCLLAGSYQQVVEIVTNYLNKNFNLNLTVHGTKNHPLFGENARNFYGIE